MTNSFSLKNGAQEAEETDFSRGVAESNGSDSFITENQSYERFVVVVGAAGPQDQTAPVGFPLQKKNLQTLIILEERLIAHRRSASVLFLLVKMK